MGEKEVRINNSGNKYFAEKLDLYFEVALEVCPISPFATEYLSCRISYGGVPMANREHIPAAKKAAYLDKQMFATIMCMIPAGKLITQEAICEMWARRKGANFCEIKGDGIMPFDKKLFWRPADVQRVDFITELKDYGEADQNSLIPYWRMISLRGMLIDYGRYFDKEAQKELLEREGHVIEQPDPNKRLYRVQNYKTALFDLNKLIINE